MGFHFYGGRVLEGFIQISLYSFLQVNGVEEWEPSIAQAILSPIVVFLFFILSLSLSLCLSVFLSAYSLSDFGPCVLDSSLLLFFLGCSLGQIFCTLVMPGISGCSIWKCVSPFNLRWQKVDRSIWTQDQGASVFQIYQQHHWTFVP